jgi:hypothetical protein
VSETAAPPGRVESQRRDAENAAGGGLEAGCLDVDDGPGVIRIE